MHEPLPRPSFPTAPSFLGASVPLLAQPLPPPAPPPPVAELCNLDGAGSNGYVQAAAELLGGAAALGPLAAERYLSAPACAVLRGVAVVTLTPNP